MLLLPCGNAPAVQCSNCGSCRTCALCIVHLLSAGCMQCIGMHPSGVVGYLSLLLRDRPTKPRARAAHVHCALAARCLHWNAPLRLCRVPVFAPAGQTCNAKTTCCTNNSTDAALYAVALLSSSILCGCIAQQQYVCCSTAEYR